MQTDSTTKRELLTIREVAELTRLSVSTIRHLVANRQELPIVRLGARTLIRRADLDEWIRRCTEPPRASDTSGEATCPT